MPRLEIDKDKFMSFLDQFTGDAPYQIALIKRIVSQLPTQASKGLIEELYYDKVYEGNVYVAQHVVFKDDIHYFQTYENMLKFLCTVNKTLGEYNTDSLLMLDKKTLQKRMAQGLPLCGYIITMKEITKDEPKPTIARFNQFQ